MSRCEHYSCALVFTVLFKFYVNSNAHSRTAMRIVKCSNGQGGLWGEFLLFAIVPSQVHANGGQPALAYGILNEQSVGLQASCGGTHTLVLSMEGRIFVWGRGSFGRLGCGTEKDHTSPVEVFLPGTLP